MSDFGSMMEQVMQHVKEGVEEAVKANALVELKTSELQYAIQINDRDKIETARNELIAAFEAKTDAYIKACRRVTDVTKKG